MAASFPLRFVVTLHTRAVFRTIRHQLIVMSDYRAMSAPAYSGMCRTTLRWRKT